MSDNKQKLIRKIAKAIRIRSNYLKDVGHADSTVLTTRMVALWLESPAGKEVIESIDVE